ncbi:MAG: hypothetical protein SP4CHLAM5_10820 [Chlamydiia bacterium]|nr:hypothetical protein [Chlamydiia bacterium]MCH9618939.1 hypothetical protein [Chlamydiia bacterium]MCH9624719.1 hypothetical protein [Chlamydiia bacterium]
MALKILLYIYNLWDPRAKIAKGFLEGSDQYEAKLRASKQVSPDVVDSILAERGRIHSLMQEHLPDYKESISIVVTNDILVENLAIFSWNDHLYLLVSAALIGRPIDHAKESGIKGWEFLARHESAHIKFGHLPWLFYTRRFFKFITYLLITFIVMTYIFPNIQEIKTCVYTSSLLYLLSWTIQTITGLITEYQADRYAISSINDREVLDDAEKTLSRIKSQATKRFPGLLGWINYVICILLVDPHPPLFIRKWMLRKRARSLSTCHGL